MASKPDAKPLTPNKTPVVAKTTSPAKPAAAKPATAKPVASKPPVAKKPAAKVAAKAPVAAKTVITKPTMTKPAAAKPAVSKPAVTQPAIKVVNKTTAAAEKDKPKASKVKMERDSFTMPKEEYAQIATLKKRLEVVGQPAKKSELLRAGLKLLAAMDDAALKAALASVPVIKTGRPKK